MYQSMMASTQRTVTEASRYFKKKCTLLDLQTSTADGHRLNSEQGIALHA